VRHVVTRCTDVFPVLLASASPRRRQLLEQVGFVVTSAPADVDERPLAEETAVDLVARLARSKANASMASLRRAPVASPAVGVAADTVVWADDVGILGKPASERDAVDMLRSLAGRSHAVSTGFCVFDAARAEVVADEVVTTEVTFHAVSDADIEAYVATGEPMDKAGAYAIQGLGAVLVRGIVGSYTNVVGLPVDAVVGVMRGHGLLRGYPWSEV